MINKLPSSIMHPYSLLNATAPETKGLTAKFLKNKTVGQICETAAKNPVVCQSVFSLAVCCFARPITNMFTTPDKKDASYASCHSISSGAIGFLWSLALSTPISMAMGAMLKKPQKYFKPSLIKKLYPSVGVIKDAKTGAEKLMTDAKGHLLRQNGTLLSRNIEPLKVEADKAAEFLKKHPDLTIDKHGVVRSTTVFQTEHGKDLKKEGKKIGCALQKSDMTPITEEVELGIKKEQNMASFMNWIPDIILAPPRAALTIAMIPWLLKNVFGMEKTKKGGDKKPETQATPVAAANTAKPVATATQPTTATTVAKPVQKIQLASIKPAQVSNNAKGGV